MARRASAPQLGDCHSRIEFVGKGLGSGGSALRWVVVKKDPSAAIRVTPKSRNVPRLLSAPFGCGRDPQQYFDNFGPSQRRHRGYAQIEHRFPQQSDGRRGTLQRPQCVKRAINGTPKHDAGPWARLGSRLAYAVLERLLVPAVLKSRFADAAGSRKSQVLGGFRETSDAPIPVFCLCLSL